MALILIIVGCYLLFCTDHPIVGLICIIGGCSQ